MIKFGTYTLYKGYFLRLVKKEDVFTLIFDGTECPFTNFIKYAENVYVLNLKKEEVLNALFIRTKCIYKGYEFDLTALNDNKYGIVTESKEAYEQLNLEYRDRGVYQLEVELDELEKIWEIRERSTYDLPLPEGIELYHEILN